MAREGVKGAVAGGVAAHVASKVATSACMTKLGAAGSAVCPGFGTVVGIAAGYVVGKAIERSRRRDDDDD